MTDAAHASPDPHLVPARYLTAAIPPLGGRIRERPEDFLVDEQPLYQPSGQGEHIYLFIEKRGLSTLSAARILASHFGVHPSAVGHAGLKDKRAVTRQVFSIHVPGRDLSDFPSFSHERMGVLWADMHTNKLRVGHLLGNRFSIRIRGVELPAVLNARRGMEILASQGVPNRIGEQRFGYMLRNHLVGRAIVLGDDQAALDSLLAPAGDLPDGQREARECYARGDYRAALDSFFKDARAERRALGVLMRGGTPRQAIRAIDRVDEQFFLSAFQSAAFNAVLDQRLLDGALGTLAEGDIAFKHDNRAAFTVEAHDLGEPLRERLDRFEISPSGPMWGPGLLRARGNADAAEVSALHALGVRVEDLDGFAARRPNRMTGSRRPLRVPLTDPEVEAGADEHGAYIRVAFDLPRGAFATTVLRELMKPELVGAVAPQDPDEPEE